MRTTKTTFLGYLLMALALLVYVSSSSAGTASSAEIGFKAGVAAMARSLPEFRWQYGPVVKIDYLLTDQADVDLKVHGMDGREIKRLVEGHQTSGNQSALWDGTDETGRRVAEGLYYYSLRVGSVETRSLVILR